MRLEDIVQAYLKSGKFRHKLVAWLVAYAHNSAPFKAYGQHHAFM